MRLPGAEGAEEVQLPGRGREQGRPRGVQRPVAHRLRRHEARAGRQHPHGRPGRPHDHASAWTPRPRAARRSRPTRSAGPGPAACTVPAPARRHQIGGLDNNGKYVFAVEAKNSVGWSTARGSPHRSSRSARLHRRANLDRGRPAERRASRPTCNATWTATAPEGPAPTLYTLSYSANGGPLTTVPGCGRVQATSVHPRRRRLRRHQLQLLPSRPTTPRTPPCASLPVAFDAIGQAGQLGRMVGRRRPAQDSTVRVTGDGTGAAGPESRGAILVGGQVVWDAATCAAGSIINELVRTFGNAAAYPVQLRMCNENAAAVGCSHSDVKTVQSYGPLRDEHLNPVTSVVEGRNVTWTISGTSNGDAGPHRHHDRRRAARRSGPRPRSGAFSFTRTVRSATTRRTPRSGCACSTTPRQDAARPIDDGPGPVRATAPAHGDARPRARRATTPTPTRPDTARPAARWPSCSCTAACAFLVIHVVGSRVNYSLPLRQWRHARRGLVRAPYTNQSDETASRPTGSSTAEPSR